MTFWKDSACWLVALSLFKLRPKQNGCQIPDDIFKCIFLNENVWILIRISLRFVPTVPIDNKPALVKIMAWRLPGDKPLSEPIMVSLLMMHIGITWPQWVEGQIRQCNSFKYIGVAPCRWWANFLNWQMHQSYWILAFHWPLEMP